MDPRYLLVVNSVPSYDLHWNSNFSRVIKCNSKNRRSGFHIDGHDYAHANDGDALTMNSAGPKINTFLLPFVEMC